MSALGRREPADWKHVERYPLTVLGAERPKGVPVVLGINWYTAFDSPSPLKRGSDVYVIAAKELGSVRGGHCIVCEPAGLYDQPSWWRWYNQGSEGACVGFGSSRAMSLLNRREYQPFWLYRAAQALEHDPPGTEGAEVRSGLEVLRTAGLVRRRRHQALQMTDAAIARDAPAADDGIAAYRWATSADNVLHALGTPTLDYVTLLNSWGESYPHRVRLSAETLDRLLRESGEAAIATDK